MARRHPLQAVVSWSLTLVFLLLSQHNMFSQVGFVPRSVATNLEIPWEIEFGPDGRLWYTERRGVLSALNIETGEARVLLDIRDSVNVDGGMLGFTWHPDFPDTPYVFVTYVSGSKEYVWHVVKQFEYVQGELVNPVEIFRLDPTGLGHQGGRLAISPDRKLFLTMGDSPYSEDPLSVNTTVGKLLRMNLDGSVPDDNPIPGNPMYSLGHRNIQGLTWGPNNNIYTAEHGNVIEDEVNLIQPAGNYGWPMVEGVCDEPHEIEYCDTAGVIEPFWSSGINETFAFSSVTFYNHPYLDSLQNSLLLCTLKNGTLYQIKLNNDGSAVEYVREHIARSLGRIRDVAIHPDGRLFVCTSNRQTGAWFPYPWPDDDRIVELVPFDNCTSTLIDIEDTVHVYGIPGKTTLAHVPVENVGTCMATLENSYNLARHEELSLSHWRYPVDVPPSEARMIRATYSPADNQPDTISATVVTTAQQFLTFTLVGSTNTGFLETDSDTLLFPGVADVTSLMPLRLQNVGNKAIHVANSTFSGIDSEYFSTLPIDTLVQPSESLDLSVRFNPDRTGEFNAQMHVNSDSPNAITVKLLSTIKQIQVSVQQSVSADASLYVSPNPFSADLRITTSGGHGVVSVYSLLGEQIWQSSVVGASQLVWNGRDTHGSPVGPGTYIVQYVTQRGVSSAMISRTQ